MKKSISLLLCIVLIFSSFSFCFASPTSWDTSDQSNLQGILRAVTSFGTSNLYYYVSQIYSLTNTISNNVNTIKGYLIDNGHGVAYWVEAISTWMSPIYNAITTIPVDLDKITNGLWKDLGNGTSQAYLNILEQSLSNYYNGQSWSSSYNKIVGSSDLLSSGGAYYLTLPNADGTLNSSTYYRWNNGTPLGNIAAIMHTLLTYQSYIYRFEYLHRDQGYDLTQNALSWSDLNSTYTFNPLSSSDGIYKWLATIQAPVARLSYVLASDERIEAQEAAAANEQAVVDNFIDSTGSGTASTSDFDSIADFSSGYKSTFASDASPTGIFDIFNSNNMGWFSQETANQLDTTSNNRAKTDNTYNTPLLDEQINSIYEQLGVKQP